MIEYRVVKPNIWRRHVEIQNPDGMPIGELKWNSAFSSKASAVIGGNVWAFKMNTWANKITIFDRLDMEIGQVKMSTWKDKAVLTYNGREYRMKRLNWSSMIYIWEDSMSQKLASVKMHYWSTKKSGSIRIYTERGDELNDLLKVLGWYLFTVKLQQSSGS